MQSCTKKLNFCFFNIMLVQTIQIEPNYHKQPWCFATYLDEVPFYHYNWTFLLCSSLHQNTIGYIPVELSNSNRRLFGLPNNVFNNNVNNNIFILNNGNSWLWYLRPIKPVIYTFIENDLVGMVAPTPVCPRAKSRELQSSSLISAYTVIDDSRYLFPKDIAIKILT